MIGAAGASGNEQGSKGEMVIIIPHTHWDREWYLPFESYRQWLVTVIDKAIDELGSGELEKFTLDGQSVVVEDYLEVRPENEKKFADLVKRKKLRIGPWYTQPDEWIPSGEALVRNLLYGRRVAEQYGGTMNVGYLPDSFGHIATLPMILKGFDISYFVFSRGVGDEGENRKNEFTWTAPDGSKVTAVFLRDGSYCGANRLGLKGGSYSPRYLSTINQRTFSLEAYYGSDFNPRAALESARSLLESLKRDSAFSVYPFFNGCDHQPPQSSAQLLKALEPLGVEVRVGDLEDFVEELEKRPKQLENYSGELRGARFNYVLSGIVSTRADVKQKNFEAEVALEAYAEPLASAQLAMGGNPRSLDYPWKLVMRSQPHDSICNTGVDEVNEQVLERLVRAREAAMGIAQSALDSIVPSLVGKVGELSVLVFNPTNSTRDELVRVYLPPVRGDRRELTDGKSASKLFSRQVTSLEGLSGRLDAYDFVAHDVPPLGFKLYSVSQGSAKEQRLETPSIENERYRVSLAADGTLTVFDKSEKREYTGLNLFLDSGDAGDEYNYSPPYVDSTYDSRNCVKAAGATSYGDWQELIVEYVMRVPRGLKGHVRSTELVELPIHLTVRLVSGSDRIDFHVELQNQAKDHMLRVVFPFPGAKKVVTGTAFGSVEHEYGKFEKGKGWPEAPARDYAFKGWAAVTDGGTGFMVSGRGLYQCWGEDVDGHSSLALTLFRSVGWLSRSDLVTRRSGAGPEVETPLSQLLKPLEFDYSLVIFEGMPPEGSAEDFRKPILGYPLLPTFNAPTNLPWEKRLLYVPEGLIVSAIKPSLDGKGLIVRVYNPGPSEVRGKFSFGLLRAKVLMLSELDERDGPMLSPVDADGAYEISVGSKRTVTLKALLRGMRT
ncbi:MAG: glycoside hydrolase family 38 C-terminal domain-containing protein [Candidatus Marsarchaeota archaeon]